MTMNAKLADALESLFPSADGRWASDGKTVTHQACTSDGRSVRIGVVQSIENYHIAVTCSNPGGRVSARHKLVFSYRNVTERAQDVAARIKCIVDAELGADFLRIVRHDCQRW
jgi:hypothetical protein